MRLLKGETEREKRDAAGLADVSFLASRRLRNAILFWGFGASGTAALVYEVVWQRELANTIGGNVYSLSILLAAFLAGLALGGHFSGILLSNKNDHVKAFGLLQLGIGLFGVATFFIVNNLETVYAWIYYGLRGSFALFQTAQLAVVFVILLVPTTLMGATFPVIAEAWSLRRREVGRTVGDVYSVNTWGAVLGALAAGFVLIPLLGLRGANQAAGLINFTLAFLAFIIDDQKRLMVLTATALAAAIGLVFVGHDSSVDFGYAMADHFSSYRMFKSATRDLVTVYDREGPYGRVQVFDDPVGPGGERVRFIVNGGRLEGSTGTDVMSMKVLAYLSLAAHDNPRSLLNIGLGTGTTLAAVGRDTRLRRIDSVEINPLMYEAVERDFFPELFKDRRVSKITDDARHYLTYTDRRYDIIISQPSYPTRKSVSHLFTKEFYDIAKAKLKPGGILIQWLPRYILSPRDLNVAVKTVKTVFPNTLAWNHTDLDMFMVAVNSNRGLDPRRIDARILRQDPTASGWGLSAKPAAFDAIMNDPSIPVNTDDLPHIEFAAARNKLTSVRRIKN